MYVNEYVDGHVEVIYLSAHLGHELGVSEFPFLPLPGSTKQDTALKVNQDIPPQRIMDGKVYLYVMTSLLQINLL